jgi:hypothetical protein
MKNKKSADRFGTAILCAAIMWIGIMYLAALTGLYVIIGK